MEIRSNFYRYLMSKCDIIIPGENPMSLKMSNILSFRIEKDYDNLYFPIFYIKLFIDIPLYYKIIKNKTTVKFNIKLESYQYQSTNEINYRETIFDSSFAIYSSDDNYFIDEQNYLNMQRITGNQMTGTPIEFYLFKESDIISSRKIINKVISSDNMTNILLYLLSTSGVSKLLMTPLDNAEYNYEVLLLPTTVIQNIIYLENRYGFYKNGSVFFYDFNNVYLLSKTATGYTYSPNEFTNVIVSIMDTSNNNSFTPGNYKDNTTKTYTLHINRGNISLTTKSITENETSGTNINIVNGQENSSILVIPDVQTRGDNTEKVIVDRFNNKYLPSMIENEKIENSNIAVITAVDHDISILAPNKRYTLAFENTEVNKTYGGWYRLSSEVSLFERQGESFSVESIIKLKKPM